MKPWTETFDSLVQLFRNKGQFIPCSESHFDRFREILSISCFQLHFFPNLKHIEDCNEPIYRLLIRAHTFLQPVESEKWVSPTCGLAQHSLDLNQDQILVSYRQMMWMTQDDGYLEVEKSFLIRPRFQWSVKLFGRLLCGSLTLPRSGSCRTH